MCRHVANVPQSEQCKDQARLQFPELTSTSSNSTRLATTCHSLPQLASTWHDLRRLSSRLKDCNQYSVSNDFSPCCQLELKLFNQIVQARKRARATECALCISLSIILAYSFLTNVLSFSALHFHCGISYAAVTRHVCLAQGVQLACLLSLFSSLSSLLSLLLHFNCFPNAAS